MLRRSIGVEVSRETVRRWLHRGGLVYRRPRPVVGPTDERREAKLAALRKLLAELPDDETAVFQDEVDVNTNPKIGSMWMVQGPAGRRSRRRATTRNATSPGRSTGGPARSSSPRASRSRAATRRCSWPTWTTCGRGCGATARST